MNVKDRFSAIRLRDESRQPWTADCTSFTRLEKACQIISTCAWQGGGGRKLKLTKQTAEAFTVSHVIMWMLPSCFWRTKTLTTFFLLYSRMKPWKSFSAKPDKEEVETFTLT
ncbi:hypothetical protein LOD99_11995 [Oopsacas minuta]|uniref:Uncharacterized protein n=1 Tax=Oopsacas minuta TaxID=111878 RepID=A0AAV7JHI1_9METZ|nr:hypothetical protein LOD99_11995 [Oopsacas minuta]